MEHFEIAAVAEKSADFRRVLWTGEHTQLVIMTIPPGGEIGEEVHDANDQVLSFVSGLGKAVIEGDSKQVKAGDVVVVPAGVKHNFLNDGPNPLVLYTVYGPADQGRGRRGRGGRKGRAVRRLMRPWAALAPRPAIDARRRWTLCASFSAATHKVGADLPFAR
jgi:mannose-6-phosphate isomerase-like protein (cupin superfamily)